MVWLGLISATPPTSHYIAIQMWAFDQDSLNEYTVPLQSKTSDLG